ncbi:MAG: phosphatidate cytidylyltransferase [Spirochaetaceae bacterium]|nr:phosphatidate cytidylyltransferase [Spirochaetaceae bacterium]
MSKVMQRLLTFIIAIPICVALVWFGKWQNHLLLNIVVIAAAVIAANEMQVLFKQNLSVQPKPFVLFLSFFVSATATLCTTFNYTMEYATFAFVFALSFILIFEIFSKKAGDEQFSDSLTRIVTSTFTILYSSFFFTFIQRMTVWQYSREIIIVFLLMVFMCDSAAWLFGVTMGKNNRGLIKVSPNKSVMGFIGGFAGSIVIGIIAHYVFPVFDSVPKVILLGVITAFAAILGDLAESVMKRSARIKDSGNIIPGRGGILDSIDSIVFAAPVFYIAIQFLFNLS